MATVEGGGLGLGFSDGAGDGGGAHGGAEEFGKETGEEAAEDGEAGADDADVGFDYRPEGGGDVPCGDQKGYWDEDGGLGRKAGGRKTEERSGEQRLGEQNWRRVVIDLQVRSGLFDDKSRVVIRRMLVTKTLYPRQKRPSLTREDLQSTERKDQHQALLIPPWHPQPIHDRHRQDNENEIRRDRKRRIGVPARGDVDTGPLHAPDVGASDRGALKDGGAGRSDAEHGDDDEEGPADAAMGLLHEDTEVEEQDRDLGQVDVELVEDLREPEELGLSGRGGKGFNEGLLTRKVIMKSGGAMSRT